jgi:hypothetical protein
VSLQWINIHCKLFFLHYIKLISVSLNPPQELFSDITVEKGHLKLEKPVELKAQNPVNPLLPPDAAPDAKVDQKRDPVQQETDSTSPMVT